MRTFTFTLTLFVVLAAPIAAQGRPSLVKNGSMTAREDVPTGWQRTWSAAGSARLRALRDTDVFREGPASLCLSSEGSPADGHVNQQIEGAPGKTLRVSGYVRRSTGLESALVFVRAMYPNTGRGQHMHVHGVREAGKWEYFSKEIKVAPDFDRAILGLHIKGRGRAWLDEAEVVEVGPLLERIDLSQFSGDPPRVVRVAPVGPAVLEVVIRARRLIPARYVRYEKRPGDRIELKTGWPHGKLLVHDGEEVGYVGGPDDGWLAIPPDVTGVPLQTVEADRKENYTISSRDDPAYADGRKPAGVHRKSKATNQVHERHYPQEHRTYLVLPRPLEEGAGYRIQLNGLNVDRQAISYRHRPRETRSSAVHVSHIGFRPDDPAKVAFLSLWMGTGGGYAGYREGMPCYLLEDPAGEVVWHGETILSKSADEASPGLHSKGRNLNKTDVYLVDFSAFDRPGRYRLYVEGVGCSYPFRIGRDAWEGAFRTSARGFYHQRSGIDLEEPYTDWTRPRGFHSDDGKVVYESTFPINEAQGQSDVFKQLVSHCTERTLEDAWGGYFDAGDWDRRIQHLSATRRKLELLILFPDYFRGVNLNIPESDNDLPDLLDEALWNLDCYRRMQTPRGGIRGGIESEEHPNAGETSWTDTLLLMAFAPDFHSSWVYAGVAARAARWFERQGMSERAAIYRDSALRAMEWAEKEFARQNADGSVENRKNFWRWKDDRNLAALELYRLTGHARWHELFRSTCGFVDEPLIFRWRRHVQRDAAFIYARLEDRTTDPGIKRNAVEGLISDAETQLEFGRKTAFRWVPRDKGSPVGLGLLSAPQPDCLLRAHALTGEKKYLRAAVLACQYGAGANPLNMCMTSGIGPNPVKNILVVDARRTGRTTPPGITVYGPRDLAFWPPEPWIVDYKLIPWVNVTPPITDWPVTEAYWDIYGWPGMCEFTVHQTMGPTVYAWGYLAARW